LRLAEIGDDDEGIDALGDEPIDVGDRLLQVALADADDLRDVRALGRSERTAAIEDFDQPLMPTPSWMPSVISFVPQNDVSSVIPKQR
jgi:hypothetical protein